ncbi:MAG: TldD/PmbA family protein [Armatimonadota bacterium]|jgi:TldD protein
MRDILLAVRDTAAAKGVKFADARGVTTERTYISRQDGRADRMSKQQSQGIGVRVLKGGSWGFAVTNVVTRDSALGCLDEAISAANLTTPKVDVELAKAPAIEAVARSEYEKDPREISSQVKMDVLRAHESEALRVAGSKAANTIVTLSDSVTRTLVCNTDGTVVDHEQVRVNIACRLVAAEGGVRQSAYEIKARVAGWEAIEAVEPDELSVLAATKALRLLSARKAPAGVFPVVLHPTVVGVFIHEAFGHNAEADLVLAGESILEGKLQSQVASPLVNVVDDATLPKLWGSYDYDSEGLPAARRQIIKDGVLVGFMHNLESAGRMGVEPNGSGRADGYAARPIVRMSNTIMEAGETPVEEMIAGIDHGILMEDGRWGYVFCQKGQYTLNAGGGRMIRNGELAEPVRDVCMVGMVLETLHNVDAVSREFELAWGGGTCGKNGQGMPVSGGGPFVRVADMVVGGQDS